MPRLKKADPRDINLTIRISSAENAALQARAGAAGMTASEYSRRAMFGAIIEAATAPASVASPVHAEARELARQVHKVGVNLNQIARRMNEERTPPPRDLTMLLDEIRAYVRQARQLAP